MAVVLPFQAIVYNSKLIKRLKNVLAPPYDEISPELQKELYRRNPCNIVRLEKGKDLRTDTEHDNKYRRAGQRYQSWLDKKILSLDEKPSYYLYEQTYWFNRKRARRMGFIGLLKLEPPGKTVFAHEATFKKPKEDRLNLLRHCPLNISPIFAAYPGNTNPICTFLLKQKKILKARFADHEGIGHRIWQISEPGALAFVQKQMMKKIIVLADGHHRYQTALRFSKTNHALPFIMTYFAEFSSLKQSLLATHRVISCRKPVKADTLLAQLSREFKISAMPAPHGKITENLVREKWLGKVTYENKSHISLGLYTGGNFYCLKMKRNAANQECDVTVLHKKIIKPYLNCDPENDIRYLRDPCEAVQLAKRNPDRIAFLLAHPELSTVYRFVRSGKLMPQKSTYFYPKLPSGLVMYPVKRKSH